MLSLVVPPDPPRKRGEPGETWELKYVTKEEAALSPAGKLIEKIVSEVDEQMAAQKSTWSIGDPVADPETEPEPPPRIFPPKPEPIPKPAPEPAPVAEVPLEPGVSMELVKRKLIPEMRLPSNPPPILPEQDYGNDRFLVW